MGRVTELDLKDYDRVEPTLPENGVDISEADDLDTDQLHPIIAQGSVDHVFARELRSCGTSSI